MTSDTGHFEQNLDVLRELGQTELANRLSGLAVSGRTEVIASKRGDLTLVYGGKALHSRYDPRKEAEGLAARLLEGLDPNRPLLVVGIGMGYLLEALPGEWRDAEVIAYEPELEIARVSLESREFGDLLRSVEYLAGDKQEFLDELRSYLGDRASSCQMVVSPAWNEFNPDLGGWITKELQENTAVAINEDSLRILLVGPVYGGSLPVTGYVEHALHQLGHEVEWFDVSPLKQSLDFFTGLKASPDHLAGIHNQYVHLMSQSVLARAIEMKPQLVFFMAQAPATPELLGELRRLGIISAMWFVEDGSRFAYGEKMAHFYDVFFHIQRGEYEEKLRAAGARNVHYLPMAADPEVHKPLTLTADEKAKYGSAVSHLGAGYPNRRQAFQALLGYDFKLWGSDWEGADGLMEVVQEDGRRIGTEEMVKVYNATKININLHSSMDLQPLDTRRDFINPRTFEVAACGAFQLVDERDTLAEMFIPGVEIETFGSLEELIEKIDHFLEHPNHAAAIARAGRERVHAEHTYRHRMIEAIEFIRGTTLLPEKRPSKQSLGKMICEAEGIDELQEFLSTLGDPEQEMTLADVGETIRNGEGEMSRPEAILLLMDEFNSWAKEKGLA